MTNLEMEDYGDIVNAVLDGPSVDGTVSFDVRWSGVLKRLTVRNEAQSFVGRFIEDVATIEWSARVPGFSFVSDPASTSKVVAAQIGHEKSGVFIRAERDEEDGEESGD